jgi:hypothetical protein
MLLLGVVWAFVAVGGGSCVGCVVQLLETGCNEGGD